MQPTPNLGLWDEASIACAYLGADHPLTRVAELRARTLERTFAVGAALALALAALVLGAPWAVSLVIAAGVVELVLVTRLASLGLEARTHALEAIITGHTDVPLAPVAHELRRLRDRDHRYELARSIARIRDIATDAGQPAMLTLFKHGVIADVAPELAETAELLVRPGTGVRGVAMVEKLVTDGTSPLYGDDPEALRMALRRIRFALTDTDDPGI